MDLFYVHHVLTRHHLRAPHFFSNTVNKLDVPEVWGANIEVFGCGKKKILSDFRLVLEAVLGLLGCRTTGDSGVTKRCFGTETVVLCPGASPALRSFCMIFSEMQCHIWKTGEQNRL